jgi:hypothetical protein
MNKRLLSFVLIALWCNSVVAAEASQLEVPATSIEQALVLAKQHVEAAKINVSDMYIAKAEWNPRFGLVSFWRIEWNTKKPIKGGYTIVTVYADGKVEHTFGK